MACVELGHAGEFTVFEDTFLRERGAPSAITTHFSVLNPVTTWSFHLQNGDPVDGGVPKVSAGSFGLNANAVFKPNDFSQQVESLTADVTEWVQLENELEVQLGAAIGSQVTLRIVGQDDTAPTLTWLQPNEGAFNQSELSAEFVARDDVSGLNPDGLMIRLDEQIVTELFVPLLSPALEQVSTGSLTLDDGVHVLVGEVTDRAGNRADQSVSFLVDTEPPVISELMPLSGAVLEEPRPVVSARFVDFVSGIDLASVQLQLDGVVVTQEAMIDESSLQWIPGTDLLEGGHELVFQVGDLAGNVSQVVRQFTLELGPPAAPVLDSHLLFTDGESVRLAGLAEKAAWLEVTGPLGVFTFPVVEDRFAVELGLKTDYVNHFSLVAIEGDGVRSPPVTTAVTQDQSPPSLFIDYPSDGAELYLTHSDVIGRVGDLLSGLIGLSVTVNGMAAEVDVGLGNNGTFIAPRVPLKTEENTELRVIASDKLGNSISKTIRVSALALPDGQPTIEVVSGNRQQGRINSLLPKPLVVAVKGSDGTPFANKVVTFDVVRSDGRLSEDGVEGGKRMLQVRSGPDGLARVFWTLGNDSGCGNNRVSVSSTSMIGTVLFCASAQAAPPKQLNIGTGNNQRAETNGPVPEPLRVWVNDGCNGVAGIPVTFTVLEGGGSIDGKQSVTVSSGLTGHVAVDFVLGPDQGNHIVMADFPGNTTTPAVFTLYGQKRGTVESAYFSGLVLDNGSQPVGGARCVLTVGETVLPPVFSDAEGQFRIDDIPVGVGTLHVDGLTATELNGHPIVAGTFPSLTYIVTIIPEAPNALPTPVLLPPLNPANSQVYDGTEDVVLTVEGVEGLRMTITAGSMRRADGTVPTPEDPAVVSLNQVHHDDVPMPMPDGVAPPFAWTLQPGGALFDPPVKIEYPNMSGLEPGAVAYFLSFDHDTERFEIVATGQVSPDGATVNSDPGTGITKAGWGCNCPPYAVTVKCLLNSLARIFGEFLDTGFIADLVEAFTNDGAQTPDTGGMDEATGVPTDGDPVILASGEFVTTETDLRIPGRGFDFEFKRTYRSRFNFNGPLGHNWDFNFNRRIEIPEATETNQDILLCNGFARLDTYRWVAERQEYESPRGFYDRLFRNEDGTVTIRDRYGFKNHFDVVGRLVRQEDRNGNALDLEYNEDGQLVRVIDTMGRPIEFFYGTNNRLKRIRDFSGREVRYTYDQFGDLRAMTSPVVVGTSTGNDFPEGKTTQYDYTSGFDEDVDPRNAFLNHNLVAITDPKGQKYLVNTYNEDRNAYGFDRVVRQQWGDVGQICFFDYREVNSEVEDPSLDVARSETVKIDRNGNRRITRQNRNGDLLEERVETNRNVNPEDSDVFITRHTYNEDSEKLSTTFPEGNQIVYRYDSNHPDRLQQGNLVQVTHLPGPRGGSQTERVQSFAYEPIYNQVRVAIDERGNAPMYVPSNGGEQSPSRYQTTWRFDYQEGNSLAPLALATGLPEARVSELLGLAGMALGVGDINEDGVTNQTGGNVVERRMPTVRLLGNSLEAQREGGISQEIVYHFGYNEFGQQTFEIDPEGHVDDFRYHPENDPDGDGQLTDSQRSLSSVTGGYLFASIRDSRSSSRRRSLEPIAQIRDEVFYDAVGNPIRTIDGRGNDTLFEVNALNQLVRRRSEAPFRFEMLQFYDGNNNLLQRDIQNVDTNGPDLGDEVIYRFDYDILDNLIEESKAVSLSEELTTRFVYDRNENRIRTIEPAGSVFERIYDERDLVFAETRGAGSPESSRTTYTYDGNRNLIREVDAEDNNGDGANEETLYQYDGFDRLIQQTDAAGNVVDYAYDPVSNRVRERRFGPNGGDSPVDNLGADNVLLASVFFRYDELNRAFEKNDRLFANLGAVGSDGPLSPGDGLVTTRWEYDRNDRQTRVLDDNGHHALYEYDGLDRLVRKVDQLNNESRFAYDSNDNLIQRVETDRSPEGLVFDETFTTHFVYDSLDRQTLQTDNLGNETRYEYDSRDNLTRTIDPMGNTVGYVYDGINRRLAEIKDLRVGGIGDGEIDTSNPANADGQIVTRSNWDANSRLASLIDDNGNETTYRYDALNRLVSEAFADGTSKTYHYDADDNLRTFIDQNGSICSSSFDGINRRIGKAFVRAEGVDGTTVQRFEYDGLSRLTLVSDNNSPELTEDDSTVMFHYDSLSRQLTEDQSLGAGGARRVARVFDGVGRQVSRTYPSGRVVQHTYDGLNRIKTIRDQGSAVSIAVYDYLGVGRILERRFANGTKLSFHDDNGNDVGYDGLRRPVRYLHRGSSGEVLAGYAYAYDGRNNRRFRQDVISGTANVYEYDSAYRLTRAGYQVSGPDLLAQGIVNNETINDDVVGLAVNPADHQRWELDGVGNWVRFDDLGTSRFFTSNEMNEYRSIDSTGRDHDANGNLRDDGVHRYAYDALNRLVRVIGENGETIAFYVYDAIGRRVSKRLTGGGGLRYLYDGNHCVEEQSESGGLLRRYVHGNGIDEVLEMEQGGDRSFFHVDSLGSIVALTDSFGNVSERLGYDAYGGTEFIDEQGNRHSASLVGIPFGYTGRRLDGESGLHYYRARYYVAFNGRFLQRDPLGYVDGLGLYGYANSNPVNLRDAFGLEAGDWWDIPSNYVRANEIYDDNLARYRGHNNLGDAKRHANANKEMTQELGAAYAWGFSTGYEVKESVKENGVVTQYFVSAGAKVGRSLAGKVSGSSVEQGGWRLDETVMDLHNNLVGIEAGLSDLPIDEDDLRILSNGGGLSDYFRKLTKPGEDQNRGNSKKTGTF